MKYRLIKRGKNDVDVITEDGGIACIYHNEENMVTMYYQMNLNEVDPKEELWEQLGYSKAYIKDWEDDMEVEVLIKNALNWLVFPEPQSWEIDNSIFSNYKF